MQAELSKCLKNCHTATTKVRLAEAKVKTATEECNAVKLEHCRAIEEFSDAFYRAGGVSVAIYDDGHVSMRDDPMGLDEADNLFVTTQVMLASGREQEISKLEIPIGSSRARTLQRLYKAVQSSGAKTAVAPLVKLVNKLIEEKVLSADDRLVSFDGLYFMKESDGWVTVWPIRPED